MLNILPQDVEVWPAKLTATGVSHCAPERNNGQNRLFWYFLRLRNYLYEVRHNSKFPERSKIGYNKEKCNYSNCRCAQALVKSGRTEEPTENYVLVEEVQKSWEHRELDKGGGCQRVMEAGESILQAQNKWKGSGRFLLRKKSMVCSLLIYRAMGWGYIKCGYGRKGH